MIKPENCLLVTRAKNEEEYLPRFLEHNGVFFDAFIALVDTSTDKSYDILKQHKKCLYIIEKVKGEYNQISDWAVLKEAANGYTYEWMWFLDPDELINHAFLQEMQQIPDYAIDIAFRFLSLYPDEHHFISGNHIYSNIYYRRKLHRRLSNYGFSLAHHVLGNKSVTFPIYQAKSLGYHFHMINEQRRNNRYSLYTKYDPEGHNDVNKYSHIVDVKKCRYLPSTLHGKFIATTEDLHAYLLELLPIHNNKIDIEALLQKLV